MTHICVSKLAIIGSDNGLSPGRRQVIIGTNAGILLIGPLGTNFSEKVIKIYTFSFKKMHLKMSSGNCRPFCLSLNVLTIWLYTCTAKINIEISYYWSANHSTSKSSAEKSLMVSHHHALLVDLKTEFIHNAYHYQCSLMKFNGLLSNCIPF